MFEDNIKKRKDHSRETKKFWREQIKKRGIQALGGKCSHCGAVLEPCCYDFHHLNPEEKDFTISNSQTNGAKSWNKIRDELKKCTLLCANCHRLVHNGYIEIENKQYFNDDYYEWDLANAKQIDHKTMSPIDIDKNMICPLCGNLKCYSSTVCIKCLFEEMKKDIPSRDELVEKLYNYNGNFTAVGKLYDVSSTTVRKWCKKYNIPFHSEDYKKQTKNKDKLPPTPSKPVHMIDKKTKEILKTFSSLHQAEQFLGKKGSNNHIVSVCKGDRKSAYGYCWSFVEV